MREKRNIETNSREKLVQRVKETGYSACERETKQKARRERRKKILNAERHSETTVWERNKTKMIAEGKRETHRAGLRKRLTKYNR